MEQKGKPKDPLAEDRELFKRAPRDAMIKKYGRELSAAELAERAKQSEKAVIDAAGIPGITTEMWEGARKILASLEPAPAVRADCFKSLADVVDDMQAAVDKLRAANVDQDPAELIHQLAVLQLKIYVAQKVVVLEPWWPMSMQPPKEE